MERKEDIFMYINKTADTLHYSAIENIIDGEHYIQIHGLIMLYGEPMKMKYNT